MNKMKKLALLFSPLLLVPVSGQGLPAGDGLATVENVCGSCHGADIVIGSQGSRALWEETVNAMRDRGAYGSEADFETVINYLAKYFGNPVNVNTASAEDLEKQFQIPTEQAAAIVKYRTDNGEFKAWEDFVMVPGLDKEDFELMKIRVVFTANK